MGVDSEYIVECYYVFSMHILIFRNLCVNILKVVEMSEYNSDFKAFLRKAFRNIYLLFTFRMEICNGFKVMHIKYF